MVILDSKKIMVEKTVIDQLICNCCGVKIDLDQYEDYITIDAKFGYFSKEFTDGTMHQSHLCEKCYKMLIEGFKYHPTKPTNIEDCRCMKEGCCI
jgi:hypothetical protein